MIGIHRIHRQLATIVHMNTDKNGNLWIGAAEIGLILPLLKRNLELVRELDELKQLSFIAYESGDVDWQHELCGRIDKLEAALT